MTITDAALLLDSKLRQYSWFTCVGQATDKIIVYTKKPAPKHLQMKSWETFPVIFKTITDVTTY